MPGGVGCKSMFTAAGFVGEMRTVAMKLHTREQAPKEGGVEAPKRNKPVRRSSVGRLVWLPCVSAAVVCCVLSGCLAAAEPLVLGHRPLPNIVTPEMQKVSMLEYNVPCRLSSSICVLTSLLVCIARSGPPHWKATCSFWQSLRWFMKHLRMY